MEMLLIDQPLFDPRKPEQKVYAEMTHWRINCLVLSNQRLHSWENNPKGSFSLVLSPTTEHCLATVNQTALKWLRMTLRVKGPNKCAADFLYMIHILIRESTFEVRDRDFWIRRRRAALIEKWIAILVRGLQSDMRCALVPVGITKFTKLIERATEFKEVFKEKERSTPSTSRNAWFPTA